MGRWPSISTLSSASSATTDGELSDDSASVDADGSVGGCESFSAGAGAERTTTEVKTEAPSGPAKAGVAGAAAATAEGVSCPTPGGKTGIDQEMGELSELFAPDAFLQSTVLDTEMETAAGGVSGGATRATASAMDMAIEPTATELSRPPQSLPSFATAAASSSLPAVVKVEYLPASATVASSPVPLAPAPPAAGSSATSTRPAAIAAAAAAAKPLVAKQECRCGEAACPSLARKRPMVDLSSSPPTAGGGTSDGGAPLSLVTGLPYAGLSSRQRKRQRSLAPVLSAPRTVSYECSLCKESYPSEISSNPWWSLFLHECPRCHRMQIPRVDAASAAVSVDYIHAVCAEEGEGCDSDG